MDDIEGIIETGIYVDDLDRAEAFYRDVLGLSVLSRETGRHVFFKAGHLSEAERADPPERAFRIAVGSTAPTRAGPREQTSLIRSPFTDLPVSRSAQWLA